MLDPVVAVRILPQIVKQVFERPSMTGVPEVVRIKDVTVGINDFFGDLGELFGSHGHGFLGLGLMCDQVIRRFRPQPVLLGRAYTQWHIQSPYRDQMKARL